MRHHIAQRHKAEVTKGCWLLWRNITEWFPLPVSEVRPQMEHGQIQWGEVALPDNYRDNPLYFICYIILYFDSTRMSLLVAKYFRQGSKFSNFDNA